MSRALRDKYANIIKSKIKPLLLLSKIMSLIKMADLVEIFTCDIMERENWLVIIIDTADNFR